MAVPGKHNLASLAGIALVLTVVIFALELISSGQYFTLDDGYYYLQIARHIARGDGATFDGLHPTNGFHPLWQLFLVPIFWATSDPAVAERTAAVLLGLFLVASAVLVYQYALRQHGAGLAFFGTLLWIGLNYRLFFMGVEYGLECLLLMAIAIFWQKSGFEKESVPGRSYFFLGLLLGLVFLARLDTILLAVVLAAWMVRKRVKSSQIAAMLAPVGLALAAYVLVSLIAFGHLLTVSAVVKHANSLGYLRADPIYQQFGWIAAKIFLAFEPLHTIAYGSIAVSVFGFGGLIAGYLLFLKRFPAFRTWFGRFIEPLMPFILYGWFSYLAFILIIHDGLSFQPWYYVIQRWLPVMGLLALFESAPNRWPVLRSRLLPAASLGLVVWVLVFPFQVGPPAYLEARNAATWINRNLEADAVLGSWNAGYLGYHTNQSVVNLDGLVNSWEYQDELPYDLCAYFSREGIDYLVDYFFPDGIRLVSANPDVLPYGRCLDRLEVIWQQGSEDGDWAVEVVRIRAETR